MKPFDLKLLRLSYGLTQKDISELLGVTQNFISKVERGERELSIDHRVLLKGILSKKGKPKYVLRRSLNS